MTPDPSQMELKQIWLMLQKTWFPEIKELEQYSVQWSGRRQKRTLASCNVRYRRVLMAKELKSEHTQIWWEPILYHEMCHAVLNVRKNGRGRLIWHDSHFRALERQHPQITPLNDWIKLGGWRKAVLSERSRSFWSKVKSKASSSLKARAKRA